MDDNVKRTTELDVIALVRDNCPDCDQVIIPPEARGEVDIYRCKAAGGKHCLVAVTTPLCVKNPLAKLQRDTEA
jgi:hypothetical protein